MRAFSETYTRAVMNPLLILLVGALLLSTVSLTGLPIGNDESNWSITAEMWADDGRLPYRDTITNKTPGIFLVHYISYTLFGSDIRGPRALALAAALLTALALYCLVRTLWSSRAAAFAAWFLVLLMPLDVVDGAFTQTETFMNLFRILSFALLLFGACTERGRRHSIHVWTLLGGILFGFAIAFKQIALLDSIPLLYILWQASSRRIVPALAAAGSLAVGALAGTAFSVFPLLLSGGTVAEYLEGAWTILFTSGIISESPFGRLSAFVKNYFEANLFLMILATAGFLAFRKRIGIVLWTPLALWTLADFAAYNIQGQYFDHHHKILLLSGSIIFGVMADAVVRRIRPAPTVPEGARSGEDERTEERERFVGAALIAILFLFYVPFQPDYFHALRNSVKGLYASEQQLLAERIASITAPRDSIYVWGERVGPLYFYSHRRPPTRQYLQSLLGREGALFELIHDLNREKPALILVPDGNPAPEWLEGFIRAEYEPLFQDSGFSVFKRRLTLPAAA